MTDQAVIPLDDDSIYGPLGQSIAAAFIAEGVNAGTNPENGEPSLPLAALANALRRVFPMPEPMAAGARIIDGHGEEWVRVGTSWRAIADDGATATTWDQLPVPVRAA